MIINHGANMRQAPHNLPGITLRVFHALEYGYGCGLPCHPVIPVEHDVRARVEEEDDVLTGIQRIPAKPVVKLYPVRQIQGPPP
jgi:hypothetical protein